ncbi:MAG: STAS domain-containing protein [Acidimicrobiales bacterium]
MNAGQQAFEFRDSVGALQYADPMLRLPEFRIESSVTDAVNHVVVSGELDAATDRALRDALAAASTRDVALDLSGVDFMGCSTLTILLQAEAKQSALGQGISICAASDPVRHLLGLTMLQRFLAP